MTTQLTIQSNNFTLSKINFTSVYQKRVVYAIIDSISPHLRNELDIQKGREEGLELGMFDIDRITYNVSSLEANKQNYNQLRKALETLKSNDVTIETDEEIMGTSFILKYKWKKHNDQISISVDRELYKFLFDLSKGYALLEMKTVLSLSSVYSMKIYELLAKWRKRPKFYIAMNELRFITNTEDIYPKIFDFKKRVLDIAKTHLDDSEITDLRFDFKYKKEGRRVVGIWFYIIKTNNSIEVKKETEQLSPRWVLSPAVIQEVKAMGIDLNGTITDIILNFSKLFLNDDDKIIEKLRFFEEKGEQAVGLDKTAPYIVKAMKNEIIKNQG